MWHRRRPKPLNINIIYVFVFNAKYIMLFFVSHRHRSLRLILKYMVEFKVIHLQKAKLLTAATVVMTLPTTDRRIDPNIDLIANSSTLTLNIDTLFPASKFSM